MRPLRLALLALVIPAAGLRAQKVAKSDDRAAVRALDSLWARMYATHDTAVALRLYADDLLFTGGNGSRKTKQQELADVRPAAGLVMDYFRTTPDSIVVRGDTATVTGRAEWRFTMNGNAREVRRSYTHTYVRGGELGWRIVAVNMGSVP